MPDNSDIIVQHLQGLRDDSSEARKSRSRIYDRIGGVEIHLATMNGQVAATRKDLDDHLLKHNREEQSRSKVFYSVLAGVVVAALVTWLGLR